MKEISYHSHHSAFGAYFSFIMGKTGKGGGFTLCDVKPLDQNLYIGYQKKDLSIYLLPFYVNKEDNPDELFDAFSEKKTSRPGNIHTISETEITRELKWASDCWKAGNLEFKILTPFRKIERPENMQTIDLKKAILPAVFAEIGFDNTGSAENIQLLFGMEGVKRILSDTTDKRILGGALDRRTGFAVKTEPGIEENIGWQTLSQIGKGEKCRNKLGTEVVLTLEVPAGIQKSFFIVLGAYQEGNITSGIDAGFAYTGVFESIEEVLDFGLENRDYYTGISMQRDKELEESGLNSYRKFLTAQATHSYHANTELLKNNENKYIWVMNEGEYRMMNTFDLTIDQIFWELRFHPWTVENNLDLFSKKYSYYDSIKDYSGSIFPGGISFTHDMGVSNMFTPEGTSSYERDNIHGCFSFMTSEELLNRVICASLYYGGTANSSWMKSNIKIFIECFLSMKARDINKDGIIDSDSMHCGGGSETTTYDSLDSSLRQSRNNLYISVKTWSAFVCLENIFQQTGLGDYAKDCGETAGRIVDTLEKYYRKDEGFIPAVLGEGNESRIIPAVEGLLYPFILNDKDAVAENGRYSKLVLLLKNHAKTILKKGICIDSVSGGWKLTSATKNTWMSKNYLCQFIVEKILKIEFPKEEKESWDKAHYLWQAVSCSELCSTDQVYSDTGKGHGSRFYPRLVTSILWMEK